MNVHYKRNRQTRVAFVHFYKHSPLTNRLMDLTNSRIGTARVVRLTDTCMILHVESEGVDAHTLHTPSPPANRLALKINIGKADDLRARAVAEQKRRILPGAVPLLRMQFFHAGHALGQLFVDKQHYDNFCAVSDIRQFAKRMERSAVLLMWRELMDGDVSQLPPSVRAKFRDALEKQLMTTLQDESVYYTGKYLDLDVSGRNILYKHSTTAAAAADQEQYKFFLTDFTNSKTTLDKNALTSKLKRAVDEIVTTRPKRART